MEIPKAYEPQSVEDKWYDVWLKHGCFTADPARVTDKRPAYSIVIPPPNVTGMLHMGHVLNNTIQDILSRKARMDGKEVLWLPGTDHAGIATEGMVARQIWKDEKKSKRDIGREEFIKRVWQWKEKHGGIIIEQLKKLGCSCDWTRERFTMDPDYVRNVQRVFVDLYKKGLIYRGKRMVNWCPATQTALSDEEVEMKPQKGFMYQFKVEVVDATPSSHEKVAATPSSPVGAKRDGGVATTARDGGVAATWLTIATTRPETIPGDTAVAVNPKDPRYAHLIGKHIVRPLPAELPREQKLIPIIGDEHVDFEFGTGVLKVTPAHDKADFEIGQRHKLAIVEVINADGSMGELAGADLRGLDRFKARKVAEEKLTELGALVEAKPYENNVGFSQRADVPIEPRLSEQWFLKYPAVEQSKACVEQTDSGPGGTGYQPVAAGNLPAAQGLPDKLSGKTGQWPVPPGKMRFHPQRWAKTYDHWLANIQDWCISRQLWWGHRIPVWRKVRKLSKQEQKGYEGVPADFFEGGEPTETSWSAVPDEFSYYRTRILDEVTIEIESITASDSESKCMEMTGWKQDPDVLDTWFSSWLWPFAAMGWPEQTDTLKKFYPTTDLVTGPDIIFFWVARMIMAGYEYMGELPFKNVYFTGIIRDKQGRKMSKTLGNSPDPLELIAQYGADALRFGTMRSAPLGQDVLFDEKDVELGRNFCNKLWNACRFRQMAGGSGGGGDASSPTLAKRDGGVASTSGDGGVAATYEVQGEINPALLTSDDKWILLKLDQAIREVTEAFAEYKFNEATATLYRFFWSEYCDWYVEASKAVLSAVAANGSSPQTSGALPSAATTDRRANTLAVIDFVLSHTLRLFHPFLPFITEELWHGMGFNADLPPDQGGQTIMFAPWPKPLSGEEKAHFGLDENGLKFAEARNELVARGRNLRREFNLASNKKVRFVLKVKDPLAPQEADVIKLLLNAESLDVDPNFAAKKGTPSALTELGELFLPLEGLVDIAAEKTRLAKELAKAVAEIERVQIKLGNANFTQKVPPAVLQEHQQRLDDWQAKKQRIETALKELE